MATIVNTPTTSRDEGSGMAVAIGLILLAIVLFLLFVYGLPLINESRSIPQINVPGQIDVNLNQPESS